MSNFSLIFRVFKTALKWEIILICASFAFIMPWHPAHAAVSSNWNGRYMMLQDTDRAGVICALEGLSFYPASNLSCRTNGAYGSSSPRYYNGYRFHYLNQAVGDRDIDDENGNPLYEGGEPVTPSCEVDKLIEGVGYPSSSGTGSSTNYGGCSAVPVGVSICRVDTSEPGGWRCVGNLRLTGSPAATEIPEVTDSPDISADPTEDVSGSESSETDTEPTVTQPDGTMIDVTTSTDTELSDSGVAISETGTHIIIVESPGVTTETETVVTVTVNPDGSYSEKTDVTVTVTNPGGTRTRINKSDGSITVETIPAGSRTDTTTQTDYFDSDGRKTGSTGSSGSSGDGPITVPGIGSGSGGDGSGSDDVTFCEYAQLVCDFLDWFKEPVELPDNPEVPFIDIEVDGFDSGIGAGVCPADSVVVTQFGAIPISWGYVCEFAITFRPVLMFFAWMTALYIIVRVK